MIDAVYCNLTAWEGHMIRATCDMLTVREGHAIGATWDMNILNAKFLAAFLKVTCIIPLTVTLPFRRGVWSMACGWHYILSS